jgi:serine/threonine protein kinase
LVADGINYGSYFLLGRLAAGGMAEVFLAKSHEAGCGDQLLAIKRMLPRLSEDPNFVSMFLDEARIAGGLSHPNICRVLDQGQFEQQLFLAMEFIHGKDLRVLKRRAQKRGEPIPPRVIAFIVAKIAEALDYAHHKTNAAGELESIVHRDISPQNILLSYDGVPKLIDFGVAKAKDRLVRTRVGVVKGKLAYMSPEQAAGQEIDARSDIFALGVVLYELLTGALPFRGQNDLSALKRVARAEYVPAQTLNVAIPPRLASVVDRALRRERSERYSTAAEMAGDLHRHLADERRELSESVLSSYIRRLFRDDYIREMTRIKEFQATTPSSTNRRSEEEPTSQTESPLPGDIRSAVSRPGAATEIPSHFLAAGYDGPPSVSEPQATPLETDPEPASTEIIDGANDPVFPTDPDGRASPPASGPASPESVVTQPGPINERSPTETLAAEPLAEFDAKTVDLRTLTPESRQTAAALAGDEHKKIEYMDESPTTALSPAEIREMLRRGGYDVDSDSSVKPVDPRSARRASPAAVDRSDREGDAGTILQAPNRGPVHPRDPSTTPVVVPADLADLASITLEPSMPAREDAAAGLTSRQFDGETEEQSVPADHTLPLPASVVKRRAAAPKRLRPARARRRTLTGAEITILVLTAALGAAAVFGAYVVSSRTSPEAPQVLEHDQPVTTP